MDSLSAGMTQAELGAAGRTSPGRKRACASGPRVGVPSPLGRAVGTEIVRRARVLVHPPDARERLATRRTPEVTRTFTPDKLTYRRGIPLLEAGMSRIPRGPPVEPGFLDIRRDLGARDFLYDRGRRDLANDPGRRDLEDDPGRIELQVLGVPSQVARPETLGISGGVVTLRRTKARSSRETTDSESNGGP